MSQIIRGRTFFFFVLIPALLVFSILIEYQNAFLPQVQAQDKLASDCEVTKTTGDYNCDGKIDLYDFESWRRDFRIGKSKLKYFNMWRRAYFNENNPNLTPSPTQPPQYTPTPTPVDPNQIKQSLINQATQSVNIQKITDNIVALADDDDKPGVDATQTRWSNSGGNQTERTFIENYLRQLGIKVTIQSFTATSPISGQRVTSANIIGRLDGKNTDKYYILTAHMDSTAARSGTNDPAPGADDNGSGTAVVLETARVLSTLQNQLSNSVELVLFSGEEQGLVGSEYYASKITNPVNILGAINMDMVGWNPAQIGDCVQFGYIARNGGNVLSDAAKYIDSFYKINLNVDSVLTNITASDHYSFVRRNIKAILVSECALMEARVGTVQPNYHSVTDTPNTLFYSQIEKTAKVITGTIIELAL